MLPLPCQAWSDSSPWHHTYTTERWPGAGLGGHNFCRNPGALREAPWCYTVDYPATRWALCDVGARSEAASCAADPAYAGPGGPLAPVAARGVETVETQELHLGNFAHGSVEEDGLRFYFAEVPASVAGLRAVLVFERGARHRGGRRSTHLQQLHALPAPHTPFSQPPAHIPAHMTSY